MGHVRVGPTRQVVLPDRRRSRAARGRDSHVAPILCGHFQSPPRAMKRSLRSWIWRVPLRREVDEEIAFHIDMRTRELIEQGMDSQAARELASARLGDIASIKQ